VPRPGFALETCSRSARARLPDADFPHPHLAQRPPSTLSRPSATILAARMARSHGPSSRPCITRITARGAWRPSSRSYCTHTTRCTDPASEPNQLALRLCTFGPTERYSRAQILRKARFWADLGDLGELAFQNMYLGCVTALLMYGDPCVTVTWPYISSCANSIPGGATPRGARSSCQARCASDHALQPS
jgi:hypothetical protein